MLILEILLWVGLFSIFYTYLFYPKLLQFLARNKKLRYDLLPLSNLPKVTIVMAAYNEEKVIEEKVCSVFNGNYPNELIEFWVGSDCSNDRTNEILTKLSNEYPQLKVHLFTERQGKINIINHFMKEVKNDIIISTDANNIFMEDTILELVSVLLSDDNIGMVETQPINHNLNNEGSSYQENTYIKGEARTKYYESLLLRVIGGPFGGCYIHRRKLWKDVPSTFVNDDFTVCINILNQGYKTIININAKIYEDVSNNPKLDFRRKIRLATGDFQNLFYFPQLLNPFSKIGFVMISHRVLRWFGPFILLFVLTVTILLTTDSTFYKIFLRIEIFSVIICSIEFLLRKININLFLLKHLTHFYLAQISMLIGFFKYLRGVKTSVWSPTQRFQKAK
jgi:cellulose synthase/poly-beta-1,6-N-acetylglucosamine synthase-like glycosyltransferase